MQCGFWTRLQTELQEAGFKTNDLKQRVRNQDTCGQEKSAVKMLPVEMGDTSLSRWEMLPCRAYFSFTIDFEPEQTTD